MTHSCLYEGSVQHRRRTPVEHRFRYALFMVYLDLSELESVFNRRWLWSTRRIAPARFRRDDYLGDPTQPLETAVRDLVERETGLRPTGPIRLLTHLRYFGYRMNPVSFYYCFDTDDRHVETVVAEVTNTPWGERHCYVLRNDAGQSIWNPVTPKEFHVSPFMGMNQQYRWTLSPPGDELDVRIESFEAGAPIFDAELNLRRRPISGWGLARVLIRFPLMTLKVAAAIYWQALRLWWKRIPFVPHPRSQQPTQVNGS